VARVVFQAAGPVVLAPPVRVAFLLDAAVCLGLAVAGLVGLLSGGDPLWPSIRGGYGLLALPPALASVAGRARTRVWRRRAMWAGVVAVFLAGRPGPSVEAGLVVLWHGALLVALLVAGRESSRAASKISGEEGLPEA
jgi:hypothetical protein